MIPHQPITRQMTTQVDKPKKQYSPNDISTLPNLCAWNLDQFPKNQ